LVSAATHLTTYPGAPEVILTAAEALTCANDEAKLKIQPLP
jgi:hypothetical protein